MLRQRDDALGFRPVGPVMAGATGGLAPPDLQAQAHRPVQGRHRAAVLVADRHPPPAVGAAAPNRPQHPLPLGPRPRLPTCHAHPLTYSSGEQRTANFAGLEKKTDKLWVWKARDRATDRIIDWELGGGGAAALERLLDRLERWGVRLYCADGWEAYAELIPQGRLYVGKEGNARDRTRSFPAAALARPLPAPHLRRLQGRAHGRRFHRPVRALRWQRQDRRSLIYAGL